MLRLSQEPSFAHLHSGGLLSWQKSSLEFRLLPDTLPAHSVLFLAVLSAVPLLSFVQAIFLGKVLVISDFLEIY